MDSKMSPSCGAKRKWLRRIVALVLVAVLCSLVGAYQTFTDPERIRTMAQEVLQQHIRGQITVGSASFSLFGGIRLFDVAVDDVVSDHPTGGNDVAPSRLFECPEVEVSHDPTAILWGELRIRSIVASEPHCSIVRDRGDGKTNLARVLEPVESAPGVSQAGIPPIELREARLSVVHRDGFSERTIEDLRLTVRGWPSRDDPLFYNIVWQCVDDSANGHSRVDLQNGTVSNVRGGLPWMSIEAVMVVVDAQFDGAGSWCDLLGLGGQVRALDYNVCADAESGVGRWATIELDDASLSIPICDEEESLAPADRYLRFKQVNGAVTVRESGMEATFSGVFHGSPCRVSARLRGGVEKINSLDDVDFEAELEANDLVLPGADPQAPAAEARFVGSLHQLERFYNRYQPAGVVDLRMSVSKRAGLDEPIVLDFAHLRVLDGRVCPVYFPYPIEGLSGLVEAASQQVYFHDLLARHEDTTLTLNGHLRRSAKRWGGELHVEGVAVPLDEKLYGALGEQNRSLWDQFHPAGKADIEVRISGGLTGDESGKWETAITAEFDDLSGSYAGFPYALDHMQGRIEKAAGRVEVEVAGRHGEARVNLAGNVTYEGTSITDVLLNIQAVDVPLDDSLLGALPQPLESEVVAFSPTGLIDAVLVMEWDPESEDVLTDGRVFLRDVAVRHEEMPIPFDCVNGAIVLSADRVNIEKMEARYQDGVLTVSGWCGRGDKRGQADLNIQCRDLLVDDELCSSLPDALGDALSRWRAVGPIDVDVTVASPAYPVDENLDVAATITLDGVGVRCAGLPVPLEQVRAEISADAGGARCGDFQARYAGADVTGAFDVKKSGNAVEADLRLTLSDLLLDENLRNALPDAYRSRWDRLEPVGAVDIKLKRLGYRNAGDGSTPVWDVDGEVRLYDAGLPALIDVKHMSGDLSVSGTVVDTLGGTTLDGQLILRAAELFQCRLSEVQTQWSFVATADGQGEFLMDDIYSYLYGGSVEARYGMSLGTGETTFRLNATARDVNIGPFFKTDVHSVMEKTSEARASGRADAKLSLLGTIGDPQSCHGQGGLEISDGRIYRLPLVLAILNFLNPATSPDPEAFDYVKAVFSIRGRRMSFEDIRLQGPTLRLRGAGKMSLMDRHVDLALRGDGRWPRVPFVSDVIDGVSRGLVELHVTGPLSQPTVTTRTLPKIGDTLRDLFKKKKPKRIKPKSR